MNAKDIATKRFLEDNRIFADAFNFYVYKGKQVIKPENLQTIDTTELVFPFGDIKKASVKKYRDIIKQCYVKYDGKAAYVLLGIENQSDIHYAMPVRAMLYDAIRYSMQVEALAKENRKSKKLKDKESFLSGLLPEDKLLPVMTLVINFSGKPWTAPTSLKQMLQETDESFLELVNDYKIHLIDPSSIDSDAFDEFKTELCPVLLFMKYSRDKEQLLKVVHEDKRFNGVPNEVILLLNIITNSKLIVNKTKGETDMCEAIKGIMEDSRRKGEREGERRGERRGVFKNLFNLISLGMITIQQAADSLNLSVEKVLKQFDAYGFKLAK